MIHRMCRSCGRTFPQYNSAQTICGLCAYNKYERPRKPMRRVGKVTKKWIDTRQQWMRDHPALGNEWRCYLCGTSLTADELTLDHIKSRSRHPELRYELSNLAPCCYSCNEAKGSRSLEEVHRKGVRLYGKNIERNTR